MRQSHAAGEKVFVDFAGDTIDVIDLDRRGAADEAVRRRHGRVELHLRAGAAERADRRLDRRARGPARFPGRRAEVRGLRQSQGRVTNPDRYEPGLNRSYLEFADHYGVAILPARPYKQRDKAKVEQSVLIAERWILARLRNRQFFSAADLNVAIAEHVGDINVRVMKGYDAGRVELFTAIDKPALKALPDEPYAFAVWKRCRVAPDYHVEVDGHWYSTPFRLIRELVDVRVADKTVRFSTRDDASPAIRGRRTAAAIRRSPSDMPSAHRRHAAWTPARVITYAEESGPRPPPYARRS